MATSVALEQALEDYFTHYHSVGFFKAFRSGAQNKAKSGQRQQKKEKVVCLGKALMPFICSGHCNSI